ncbi:MAG: DUF222 domain-containing protein [Ilumatobacteraceae bacterium]
MGVGTLEAQLAETPAEPVEDRLAVLCGQRNALDAQLVALVGEVLASGEWEVPGVISPSHWLTWKAGLSTSRARQVVSMAARRAELPVTFAAFDAGELSIDQVAPIVAKVPTYADRDMREMAGAMTVTQISRVVRSFDGERAADKDRRPDDDPKPESVSMSHLAHDRWQIRGELDLDHGAIVDLALREAQDALFQREGCRITRADALVEIANRSLDTVTDPARRDRYRLHIHVDSDGDAVDGMGRRVPAWLRDLICCDTILSAVFESGGIPVSVGRSQRTIPERTRRLVVLRDRGCRVPGCAAERVLQVHHIIHWDPDDGEGGTDTWNLVCLCPRHHRMHHQGLLGISGNADDVHGLTFTDRHGTVLHPGPRPRPPTGPPPPAARYRHPLGERLQMRWVTFNPPPASRPATDVN